MIWPARKSAGTRPARQQRPARRRPAIDRVRLDALRPDPVALIGQAAYLELALFETASTVAARASDLAAREVLTRVAAAVLAKHHGLTDLLRARGTDSVTAMAPFVEDIERYRRRVSDSGWHQSVLTVHLASGLLDDFLARLAAGIPGEEGRRVAEILDADIGHPAMAAILTEAVLADRRLASMLALWGRRIVGDTLLVARSALPLPPGAPAGADDVHIEPVLTDVIASHTRRMDALGLTA